MSRDFQPLRAASKKSKQHLLPSSDENQLESDHLRAKYFIEINGSNVPKPIPLFEQMKLPSSITHHLLHSKKFKKPTPIQMQVIPCLLNKQDVIALSSTGTGKTYAYVLPMIQLLLDDDYSNKGKNSSNHLSCLIVVPTRELVNQVKSVVSKLLALSFPKYNSSKNLRENVYGDAQQSQYVDNQHTWSSQYSQYNANYIHFNTFHNHYQPTDLIAQGYSNHLTTHFNRPSVADYQMQHMLMNTNNTMYYQQPSQNQSNKINGHSHSSIVVGVTGGVPINETLLQIASETKVVIATPGRLIDLCERNLLSLETVKYFVVDECDKLLELGFEEQLRKVVNRMHLSETSAQVSLFSATLPESLERLARSATVNPVYVCAGIENTIPLNITQNVKFTHTYLKPKLLFETLRETPYPPVLIFTSSKSKAEEITEILLDEQFHVAAIHSDKSQKIRNETMNDYLNNEFDTLVATDLVSRGLDMPDITHVIHFDMPDTIEDYIHRSGRTGRFGRPGCATSFLTLDCKIAKELKELLEATNNNIPPELNDIKVFGKKILKTEMGDRVIE